MTKHRQVRAPRCGQCHSTQGLPPGEALCDHCVAALALRRHTNPKRHARATRPLVGEAEASALLALKGRLLRRG